MEAKNRSESAILWDWPTRLFHWLLVCAVLTLFVTAKLGGNWMEWHARAGYFALCFLLFRLFWGFVGSSTSRFGNFVRGPARVLAYLRTGGRDTDGHSPIGALSIVAMLVALGVQASSGMFANDDILLEGPYVSVVGKDASDAITRIHKANAYIVGALVMLHLIAIGYYAFRDGSGMIRAMVTGKGPVTASGRRFLAPAWRAVFVAICAAILVVLLVYRGTPFT